MRLRGIDGCSAGLVVAVANGDFTDGASDAFVGIIPGVQAHVQPTTLPAPPKSRQVATL